MKKGCCLGEVTNMLCSQRLSRVGTIRAASGKQSRSGAGTDAALLHTLRAWVRVTLLKLVPPRGAAGGADMGGHAAPEAAQPGLDPRRQAILDHRATHGWRGHDGLHREEAPQFGHVAYLHDGQIASGGGLIANRRTGVGGTSQLGDQDQRSPEQRRLQKHFPGFTHFFRLHMRSGPQSTLRAAIGRTGCAPDHG